MTRPTITTTRPVTSPVTTPVRSPFGPPKASPFGPAMFRPNPFSASPFAPAASGGKSILRSPFRRPQDPRLKAGQRNRRTVILPTLGPQRHERKRGVQRVLPYDEICQMYEMSPFTYLPGMGENFDGLARARAHEDGEGDCDLLSDGWCLGLDSEDEHRHPFGTVSLLPGECPLAHSVNYDASTANMDRLGQELWDEFLEVFTSARAMLERDPEILLSEDSVRGRMAATVLQAAGWEGINGFCRVDELVEVVRWHLGTDESLQDAFLDLGVLLYAGASEVLPDVDDLVDGLSDNDCYVFSADELTFLAFDPDDLPKNGQVLGDWVAVDATYESMFRPGREKMRERWPLAIGWREVMMRH